MEEYHDYHIYAKEICCGVEMYSKYIGTISTTEEKCEEDTKKFVAENNRIHKEIYHNEIPYIQGKVKAETNFDTHSLAHIIKI